LQIGKEGIETPSETTASNRFCLSIYFTGKMLQLTYENGEKGNHHRVETTSGKTGNTKSQSRENYKFQPLKAKKLEDFELSYQIP
jgi:hypothetical protein